MQVVCRASPILVPSRLTPCAFLLTPCAFLLAHARGGGGREGDTPWHGRYEIFQVVVQLYTQHFVTMLQKMSDRAEQIENIDILKVREGGEGRGWEREGGGFWQCGNMASTVCNMCARVWSWSGPRLCSSSNAHPCSSCIQQLTSPCFPSSLAPPLSSCPPTHAGLSVSRRHS